MGKVRVLLAAIAVAIPALTGVPAAAQSTGNMVINEIHYDPAGDVATEDFLELHNPTSVAISLDGYALTQGVDWTAPAGLSVAPGDYFVLAPQDNTFQSKYGFAPDATFDDGGLKGSGELLELSLNGTPIDTVDYGDDLPWPPEANRMGSSLELIDALTDNADPVNWQASSPAPTPGAVNSVPVPVTESIDLPVSTPVRPTNSDLITVSTNVLGVSAATLTYVVDFEPPVQLPMAISNGTATASIPAQPAGSLVRYRIDTAGSVASPATTDSISYHGVVVVDPTVATDGAPIFEWFVADDDLQFLLDDRLDDTRSVSAVLAYDGVVYDNVTVAIRGGDYARGNNPKQSFSFDMASGYDFVAPSLLDYPVDEFALQTDYSDRSLGRAISSWSVFEDAGLPKVHNFFVRVERNGEFFGVYRFQEKLDGTWRNAHDLNDGQFYKAQTGGFGSATGFDKKDPKDGDYSTVIEVIRLLRETDSATKTDELFRTFDIPNVVNYMAASSVVDHDDQGYHNLYTFQDVGGTELWSLYPWDLDLTMGLNFRCTEAEIDLRCLNRNLFDSLLNVPEIESMYWARIGTLRREGIITTSDIETSYQSSLGLIGSATAELERTTWNRHDLFNSSSQSTFIAEVQERRDKLDAEPNIPLAGDDNDIVISELHYKPANDGPEILELANIGSLPVDVSDWVIPAVHKDDNTIPPGTIILPGERIVLTDSVSDLLASYPELPNVVVIGYTGGLGGSGELVELMSDDGVVVDSVSYSATTPWPTAPAAGVVTLELSDLTIDNTAASAWLPSIVDGGTPGAENSVEDPTSPPVVDPPGTGQTTIEVHAKGSTGQEEAIVSIDGTEIGRFTANTNLTTHTFTTTNTNPNATIRVAFTNDQVQPVDRNLTIDAITINGTRLETEDPTTFSTGSWNPDTGCRPGFKASEKLHCNGHFDYQLTPDTTDPGDPSDPVDPVDPVDPPGTGQTTIEVHAKGSTGQEEAIVSIDGTEIGRFTANTNLTTHTFTTTNTNPNATIRVAFTNDQVQPVDRNLTIDAITINGTRLETEDPTTFSTGSWNPDTGCRPGFKASEKLHCNGHFDYQLTPDTTDPGDPSDPVDPVDPVDPPGTGQTTIEVHAKGSTGQEEAIVSIDGTEIGRFTANTNLTTHTFTTTNTNPNATIRVAFTNDQVQPVDRNLTIDAITINGTRLETEDPTTFSTGSWNPDTGCRPGFKASEKLHCNGHFDYQR